jgi:hypothetical protein
MLTIEEKIKIFEKRFFQNFKEGVYNYPVDDISDYFFIDYDKNDSEYNKRTFKFLEVAKSEQDIIQISNLLISRVLKYDDTDGLENIIESFTNDGFILLEDYIA